MEYWKRIHLDPAVLKTIQIKTLDFLEKHTTLLDKEKFRGPFNHLDDFQYIKHVPEIRDAFKPHGLHFEGANVFVMWDNRDAEPHKDYADTIARINIPILNCENTYTIFYEGLQSRRMVLPTGAPFYLTLNKDCKEVTRVQLTEPIIMRISEGHHIVMDESRAPRISLTMAFNPDVGLLLDD